MEPNVPSVPEVTERVAAVDYFGFAKSDKFYLPDGVSWVELKSMNEGDKADYQRMTQKDVVLEKNSGNARMKIDAATERHQLIKTCLKDWNLERNGIPLRFSEASVRDFLKLADPSVIELIEKEIRKINPWLLSEMSVEDIDKEIDNLREMREVAERGSGGKATR